MLKTEEIIEEFLGKKNNYYGYKKVVVRNLLDCFKENNKDDVLSEDAVKQSIIDTVKAYTSSKDNAIVIFKRFLHYIENQHGMRIKMFYPPISISNTFERLMFIAKYIQEPDSDLNELENVLWVGRRTINADIDLLKGRDIDINEDKAIQICGKKFIIPDIERTNKRVSYSSTVHPLFLTSNLTQVIVTLKGLKVMSMDFAFNKYAVKMARSIWQQLSNYAKKRIIFVAENLIPDDVGWYESLNEKEEYSYYNEYGCSSTVGVGCICDCMKNEKTCFIEYQKDDITNVFYSNCKVKKYNGDSFTIQCEGIDTVLKVKQILRSSYTIDELI